MSLRARIFRKRAAGADSNASQDGSPTHSDLDSDATRPIAPAFLGFPYLVTHICPGVFHMLLLPDDFIMRGLLHLAKRQVLANRLYTCLVLGIDTAIFMTPDGQESPLFMPPRSGIRVGGRLLPVQPLSDSETNRVRAEGLAAYAKEHGNGGWITVSLRKDGRDATEAEISSLSGLNSAGVPKGLVRCQSCREWCGHCIEHIPAFGTQLLEVSCLCQNDNLCARCGNTLYARKLNANYYNPEDRSIWHVPGFLAFEHICPDKRFNGR